MLIRDDQFSILQHKRGVEYVWKAATFDVCLDVSLELTKSIVISSSR